jgi:hypothetical protein
MSPSTAPTFILATSRSGSTLLRFIIDSHPDFACPPETQVAGRGRASGADLGLA